MSPACLACVLDHGASEELRHPFLAHKEAPMNIGVMLHGTKRPNNFRCRTVATTAMALALGTEYLYSLLHLFSLRIGICSPQIGRLHWCRQLGYHSGKGRLISTLVHLYRQGALKIDTVHLVDTGHRI